MQAARFITFTVLTFAKFSWLVWFGFWVLAVGWLVVCWAGCFGMFGWCLFGWLVNVGWFAGFRLMAGCSRICLGWFVGFNAVWTRLVCFIRFDWAGGWLAGLVDWFARSVERCNSNLCFWS